MIVSSWQHAHLNWELSPMTSWTARTAPSDVDLQCGNHLPHSLLCDYGLRNGPRFHYVQKFSLYFFVQNRRITVIIGAMAISYLIRVSNQHESAVYTLLECAQRQRNVQRQFWLEPQGSPKRLEETLRLECARTMLWSKACWFPKWQDLLISMNVCLHQQCSKCTCCIHSLNKPKCT